MLTLPSKEEKKEATMKVDPQRAVIAAKIEKVWPPPIHFKEPSPKSKKTKKGEGSDEETEKNRYRSFEIKFDASQTDSESYTRKVKIFEEGTPEEWVRHQVEVEDLFVAGNFTTTAQKVAIYRALFDGKSKDVFGHYTNKRTVENAARTASEQWSEDKVLEQVINDMARKIFGNNWANAARTQKGYLRKNLSIEEQDPEVFYKRLKTINSYSTYFPH